MAESAVEPKPPEVSSGRAAAEARDIDLKGRSLRQHAARGVAINASFQVGLAFVAVARRFFIAIFLTAADYGVWGLIYTAVIAVLFLKDVGIGDKYIQQDEDDQEAAYQKAFSLDVIWSGLFAVLVAAAIPLFSLLYGRPEIILPGMLMAVAVLASPFQSPMWVFYRQMRFVRQRALAAIEPVFGFIVTMALGAAGLGYWALVIGLVAAAWVTALACVIASPYRLRWRLEPGVVREYYSFSWPLLISAGSGLVVIQLAVLIGESEIGLAGVGAIGLSGAILTFAERADTVVTQTLYPAICAVQDRIDLLRESFTKSNRIGLMWSIPFCLSLTLFAPDLVHHVLGSEWDIAIGLLQVFGVACAVKQIAFNWTAYHRAVGDTRPIAVNSVSGLVVFLAVGVPGMFLWGLTGYAVAICAMNAVSLVVRAYYLGKLFGGLGPVTQSLRAILPVVPAVAAVLLLRLAETGDRTGGMALIELGLYVVVAVLATWLFERRLLREALGYFRGGAQPQPVA
jgi:O-antigen/teichoic acid export membrane protein